MTIGGTEYQWYDPEIFTDISEIDLLVVDGPPEIVGSEARYPAVPLLEQRLAAKAMIVLDDAERNDEDRIAARWVAEFSGLQRVPSLHDRQAQFEYDRDRALVVALRALGRISRTSRPVVLGEVWARSASVDLEARHDPVTVAATPTGPGEQRSREPRPVRRAAPVMMRRT